MQTKTRQFVSGFKILSPLMERVAKDVADGGNQETVAIRNSRELVALVSSLSKEMEGENPSAEILACCSKMVASVGCSAKSATVLKSIISETARAAEKITVSNDTLEEDALLNVAGSVASFYLEMFDFFRQVEKDMPFFLESVIESAKLSVVKLSVPKSKKEVQFVSGASIEASGKVLISILTADAKRFFKETEGEDSSVVEEKVRKAFGDVWLASVSSRLNEKMVMLAEAVANLVPRGKSKEA